MMNYRGSKTDETRLGILGKAIELVGQAKAEVPLGVRELVQVLDQEDPELVAAVGSSIPALPCLGGKPGNAALALRGAACCGR